MSSEDTPIVNDAITSDDAGLGGSVGDQIIEDSVTEATEEVVEQETPTESEKAETQVQSENDEDFKQEVEDAIEEGATEQEIQEMIKEYKIKVNGKEKTVKLDLSNEEDIIRKLQLAEMSHLSMQQKRELEKEYEQEVKRLLQDPKSTLKELGLDPLKLGEEWLRQEVEDRKKSPEMRAKEQLEKELAEARRKLQEQEEQSKNARMAQLQVEEAQKLEVEIEQALDAHKTLPRSPKTVARIADALLWTMDNAETLGIDPEQVTVEDVIPTVENEIRRELASFMDELPEELMEEYIGKKNLERLRKNRLTAMKPNNVSSVKPVAKKEIEKEQQSGKKSKLKMKDYFNNL
jgi:hypothetical protein